MKKNLWKVAAVAASALCIGLSLSSCQSQSNDETANELKKLKTKYVNPLQFDTANISGVAVTKSSTAARFAQNNEVTNLVVIKDDGKTEPAIVLGTEENAAVTEAPKTTENKDVEYRYVKTENSVVAKALETKQCPYELNDAEASGYYIVFNGKSTFVYDDDSTRSTGSLIYVTPAGVEKDVFANANESLDTVLDFYMTAYSGCPYMLFDENGNAFFIARQSDGSKIYRYQPIADKLDNLTPAGITGLSIQNFSVSLDGKYILFTYTDEANKKKGVKAVKIADKSVTDVFTCTVPVKYFDVPNIVYMDKNHSFYFLTTSWSVDEDKDSAKYDNVDNYLNRWNYETKKLDSVKYTSESKYYNKDVNDPAEGDGPLIVTAEGVFVMQPNTWVIDEKNPKGHWTCSKIAKLIDANGDYMVCTIPSSLKDKVFAAPRYNLVIENPDYTDPETWYTPSFLSNGKGIAVIGKIPGSKTQDTIYYYAENQLKNLLAFDTDRQQINRMTLSDKSIIFNADGKGDSKYTKSIDIEDGSVTTVSINGTVLNMLAVKGKSISAANNAKVTCKVTISAQNDLKIDEKQENGKLTLTAPEGYISYEWSCNKVILNNTNKFEKTVSTWAKGYYPIYVTAKKDGLIYSSFVEVEVK